MNKMNPKVDVFLSKVKKWQVEFEKLRMIILNIIFMVITSDKKIVGEAHQMISIDPGM